MRILSKIETANIDRAIKRAKTELRELEALLNKSAPGNEHLGDAWADMRSVWGAFNDVERQYLEGSKE